MARVCSGAEEALAPMDRTVKKPAKKSEAFMMSGDAIISLNRNVSSTYAKLLGEQLPPNIEVHNNSPLTRAAASAGVSFPSMTRVNSNESTGKMKSRLPVSTSQLEASRRINTSYSMPPSMGAGDAETSQVSAIKMIRNRSSGDDEEECNVTVNDVLEQCEQVAEALSRDDSILEHSGHIENEADTSQENRSPNEDIVAKSLRSAMFAPAASAHSSPQIISANTSVRNHNNTTMFSASSATFAIASPSSENAGNTSLPPCGKMTSPSFGAQSTPSFDAKNASFVMNENDTPSKRSVVTVNGGATPSRYNMSNGYGQDEVVEIDYDGTAYYTTTATPPHQNASANSSAYNHHVIAGGNTTTSASNSPSLRRILATQQQNRDSSFGSGTGTSSNASPSLILAGKGRSGSVRSVEEEDEEVDGSVLMMSSSSPKKKAMKAMKAGDGDDEKEASQLARRLFELGGYTVADVADKLNEQSEFAQSVLVKYLEQFQFSNMRIDAALREFLSRVELRGESSQRERLLRVFSQRYHECNPTIFENLDDVHTLTCALLLLNSDLHGPNGGKRMSPRDFITNIGHTGADFKRELLKTLYNSIKDNQIALGQSTQQTSPSDDLKRKKSRRESIRVMQQKCGFEADPNEQVEYKSGYVVRKFVKDADGTQTPFGRRGWHMWYARLCGLVLYFDTDESPKAKSRYQTFSNCVSLHHALAEPAHDYRKKQHVFRVYTAQLGEILLRTSNDTEMAAWCSTINFVAAAFSSPTLPLAAQSTFVPPQRGRLPRIPSVATIPRQLRDHESRIAELRAIVEQSISVARPECSMAPELKLVIYDLRRYETYARQLRRHIEEDVKKRGGDAATPMTTRSVICDEKDRMSYVGAINNC